MIRFIYNYLVNEKRKIKKRNRFANKKLKDIEHANKLLKQRNIKMQNCVNEMASMNSVMNNITVKHGLWSKNKTENS